MLEHVTANQTRFVAPGLNPDVRGVALGRLLVVLLPSLDRVMGFFRGLSERGSLDDVLPSMKIIQVKTPLKSREFIVELPVTNSHAADALAAVSSLMGGLTFTGSAKHFVRYRDSRSPLGYDVDSLHAASGDFILYDKDFVQSYSHENELSFAKLALNLSVQVERNDTLREEEPILLRVVPGMWRAVVGYLHRNNLPCEVATCDDEGGLRFYLIRCKLISRMVQLFRSTPGIELHRLLMPQVAVQVGFRHPIELNSCAGIFKAGCFYLFSGARNRLDIVDGEPVFIQASALVHLGDPSRHPEVSRARSQTADAFGLAIRLEVSIGSGRTICASRVPMPQAAWLKKLVYLLPTPVLSQYNICVTHDAIYLHSDAGIEFIPLGDLFYAFAPGVLVQLGFEILPRVHPNVLREHLSSDPEKLFFFSANSPAPLELSRADFLPLSRCALAPIDVQRPEPQQRPDPLVHSTELINEEVGLFPLWGFSDVKKKKP